MTHDANFKSAKPQQASRSVQRRIAMQKGEPIPTFVPAGPQQATGERDWKDLFDAIQTVLEWEHDYRTRNNLGKDAPNCFHQLGIWAALVETRAQQPTDGALRGLPDKWRKRVAPIANLGESNQILAGWVNSCADELEAVLRALAAQPTQQVADGALREALRETLSALGYFQAAIGDALLSGRGLEREYANSVINRIEAARTVGERALAAQASSDPSDKASDMKVSGDRIKEAREWELEWVLQTLAQECTALRDTRHASNGIREAYGEIAKRRDSIAGEESHATLLGIDEVKAVAKATLERCYPPDAREREGVILDLEQSATCEVLASLQQLGYAFIKTTTATFSATATPDTAPMGGAKGGDKGAKMNFPYDEIKSLVWDYEARAADIPRLEKMLQKATENTIGIQKELDVCHAELRRVDSRMAEILQRAAQATTASESAPGEERE